VFLDRRFDVFGVIFFWLFCLGWAFLGFVFMGFLLGVFGVVGVFCGSGNCRVGLGTVCGFLFGFLWGWFFFIVCFVFDGDFLWFVSFLFVCWVILEGELFG